MLNETKKHILSPCKKSEFVQVLECHFRIFWIKSIIEQKSPNRNDSREIDIPKMYANFAVAKKGASSMLKIL